LTQRVDRSSLAGALAKVGPRDVVVASTSFALPAIPRRLWPQTILDAHNIEARVVAQLARSEESRLRRWAYGATVEWTRRYEERAFSVLAGVWTVSEVERALVDRVGGARSWFVPNGVTRPVSVAPPSVDRKLLFVASLRSQFNRQGVEWFIENCWRTVLSEVPTASLVVVGAGSADLTGPRVIGLGAVPSLDPIYAEATCCIVPLLGGAGTRLKVPEAMAFGRPVVSTSIGVEGHDVSRQDGVLIVNGPNAFAASCIEVLCSPATAGELGRRARAASVQFTWERAAQAAVGSVEAVMAERRKG